MSTPVCSKSMRKVLLGIMMIALLNSCGERSKSVSTKKKQLNPEQATCIKNVLNEQLTLATKFSKLEAEALMAKHSTIPFTLERRRANEGFCAEEAACYGYEEPTNSLIFESCLNASEQEQPSD